MRRKCENPCLVHSNRPPPPSIPLTLAHQWAAVQPTAPCNSDVGHLGFCFLINTRSLTFLRRPLPPPSFVLTAWKINNIVEILTAVVVVSTRYKGFLSLSKRFVVRRGSSRFSINLLRAIHERRTARFLKIWARVGGICENEYRCKLVMVISRLKGGYIYLLYFSCHFFFFSFSLFDRRSLVYQ